MRCGSSGNWRAAVALGCRPSPFRNWSSTATSQANRAVNHALAESIGANGGSSPREADANVNDAARSLVAAVLRDHGSAWLGIVNRSRNDHRPWIWPWDGAQPVENFGADFVLPAHDAELERLLRERHAAPYTGVADDRRLVEGILSRISAAGGFSLVWT